MAVVLKQNVFPIEILAWKTSFLICRGCRLQQAIEDIKFLVQENKKVFGGIVELEKISENFYDIRLIDEKEVPGLDKTAYEITREGIPIIWRTGMKAETWPAGIKGKIETSLHHKKFCVIQ